MKNRLYVKSDATAFGPGIEKDKDGWLATSDIVTQSVDKQLFITGRESTNVRLPTGELFPSIELKIALEKDPRIHLARVANVDGKLVAIISLANDSSVSVDDVNQILDSSASIKQPIEISKIVIAEYRMDRDQIKPVLRPKARKKA